MATPCRAPGHEINWRAGKSRDRCGQTINMTVKLYQGGGNSLGGGTLIADFDRNAVGRAHQLYGDVVGWRGGRDHRLYGSVSGVLGDRLDAFWLGSKRFINQEAGYARAGGVGSGVSEFVSGQRRGVVSWATFKAPAVAPIAKTGAGVSGLVGSGRSGGGVWANAVLALNPTSYWRFRSGAPLLNHGTAGDTLTAVGSPSQIASLIPSDAESSSAYRAQRDIAVPSTPKTCSTCCQPPTGRCRAGSGSTTRLFTASASFLRLFEKRQNNSANNGWHLYGGGHGYPPATTFDWINASGATEGHGIDSRPHRGARWIVFTWEG